MKTNRTSQALQNMDANCKTIFHGLNEVPRKIGEEPVTMRFKEWAAIAAKYQKMADSLQQWVDNSECYDEQDYCGECHHCVAVDALKFDPLPPTE